MPEQVLTTPEPSPGGDLPPPIIDGDGAAPSPPEDDSTPEQKELAREQGWRDQGEYDGTPDKFVGAKEYLDRAEHILPILRSRERESKAEVQRLRTEMENLKKDSQQQIEFANARAKRELTEKYEGLKKQRAQAVSDGDGVEFDRLDGEMQQILRESQPKKTEVPPDPQHSPELKAAAKDFESRNNWFEKDARKTRLTMVTAQDLIEKRPELKNNPTFFGELEKELRAVYPEIFGNQRRAAVDPMVEGDSRPAGARSVKKGFRDLPKDAQEAAARQVKNGLCKTTQEYVDIYFETYGDA